jgi:branched-chain amino acid transport system ATP-binding protein
MSILELQKISKSFGGVRAVENLDLRVEKGEILGLIGPNGAGKTTAFHVISGVHPPSKGRILFEGQDITGMKAYKIAKMGIARTFQITSLFMKYTVLENVLTGFHLSLRSGLWSSLFPTTEIVNKENRIRERALEILSFLEIGHLQNQCWTNLSVDSTRKR